MAGNKTCSMIAIHLTHPNQTSLSRFAAVQIHRWFFPTWPKFSKTKHWNYLHSTQIEHLTPVVSLGSSGTRQTAGRQVFPALARACWRTWPRRVSWCSYLSAARLYTFRVCQAQLCTIRNNSFPVRRTWDCTSTVRSIGVCMWGRLWRASTCASTGLWGSPFFVQYCCALVRSIRRLLPVIGLETVRSTKSSIRLAWVKMTFSQCFLPNKVN